MANRNDNLNSTDALLRQLAEQLGYSLQPIAQEPAPAARPSRRAAQRKQQSGYHATVTQRPASGQSQSQQGPRIYGTAPTAIGQHNMPDPAGTHRVRLDALEAAMPGITKIAYVFSVGKNAKGNLEKNLRLMVNNPFTYIELPAGKATVVGGLTPDEVRSKLKACGYGFTKQRDSSGNLACFWGCDSNGRPLRRVAKGYHKQNVAAQMVSSTDE